MVSLSDLAAMAAVPRYALVALTLPEVAGDTCQQWVQQPAAWRQPPKRRIQRYAAAM